ncbi:MAG: transporter [Actinomycetia bacterium]|nr:transporter [Actinomycetes bacterium]
MLRRPRLDVMQPCLSPGAFVLGLLAELPRKNCRTIAEQGRLCLPVVDLDHVCSGRCGWTRGRNIRSTISTRVSSGSGAFLVAAAATVPFAFAGPHTSLWPLGAVLLIRGFAIGTVLVPPLSIAYQDIPPDGIPHATMNTRITQQVGTSFGIAIVAVVLQSQLAHSATSAFQGAFWWATGITTAALIPALTLPTRAREGD